MRRARGDGGQVGGFEALPVGILIFVVGALLVTNAWSVIDAKLAVTAAAREAGRAFVEAGDASEAGPNAVEAALAEMGARGRSRSRAKVEVAAGEFRRCQLVTVEISYVVPTLSLPFVGGWGEGFHVSARHAEIVDPYRNGPEGEADCA